jgi:hypothetical protein
VTWTAVNTGLSGLATSLRILLTIHNSGVNNVVYADVIATNGTLSGVFRSTNQGGIWASLGVPSPSIYPGGQGFFHGAFAADPSNPNVVFISGDRGPVFRHTGIVWEEVVFLGAHGTSPHSDSRFMAFDARGNLLQTNDGGIARLVNPNTVATRQWASVVGNIRSAEFHSIAYDPLSNIVFGGTQDNGTPIQTSPGAITWNEFLGGDGGVVGVDANQVTHPGTSLRYTSFQRFGFFNRGTWNASNTFLGNVAVGLHITAGLGTGQTLFQFDPNIDFYQPYTLNAIDPARMLIGTRNIYESLNGGDSLNNLGSVGQQVGFGEGWGRAMVYGGRLSGSPNPNVFYVGAANQIFHRVTAGGPITMLGSYPGGVVITIAMNPNNYKQVYVADLNNKVWGSSDEGATWVDLTANLPSLTGLVTTIEVNSPDGTVANTVLLAGGFGVFHLRNPSSSSGHWTRLTGGGDGDDRISNALVLDLHVDYTRNVLAAGTLGRGAWLFGDEDVIGEIASRAVPSASSIAAASSTAAKPILPPAPPPSVNPPPNPVSKSGR